MKNLFLLFLLLSIMPLKAQTPIEKDTVLYAEGVTAQQIFDRINVYFVSFAKHDSRSMIQICDKEKLHLVGTFAIPFSDESLIYAKTSGYIDVLFDITAREGRYRLKLNRYTHEANDRTLDWYSAGLICDSPLPNMGLNKKTYYKHIIKKSMPLINRQWKTMLQELQEAVTSLTPDEEDW